MVANDALAMTCLRSDANDVPRVRGSTFLDMIFWHFQGRSIALDLVADDELEAGAAVAARVAGMASVAEQLSAMRVADSLIRAEIAQRRVARVRMVGPRCGVFDDDMWALVPAPGSPSAESQVREAVVRLVG